MSPVVHSLEVMEQKPNLDALADRLREVRRQLSRSEPLANVLDRQQQSAATLRAAQRLEHAVKTLEEEKPPPRITDRNTKVGLQWLVEVIERRAGSLEQSLGAPSDASITGQPSARH